MPVASFYEIFRILVVVWINKLIEKKLLDQVEQFLVAFPSFFNGYPHFFRIRNFDLHDVLGKPFR